MTRLYAQDTSVPVGRTRGEIDELLRSWGCDAIQWSDDFAAGRVQLRFVWRRKLPDAPGATPYVARFGVQLPRAADVAREYKEEHPYSYGLADAKAQQIAEQRARAGHRVLLLWLKAALNAVNCGLVSAEAIFLPFLEDASGKTVAEIAIPRMDALLQGSALRLLGDGR